MIPKLVSCIDLTVLSDDVNLKDIQELCHMARRYVVASVCIKPKWVCKVKELLKGTDIKVCSVANFPEGKDNFNDIYEQIDALVLQGADEIDVVIPKLDTSDNPNRIDTLQSFLVKIRQCAYQKTIKLILESSTLCAEEIRLYCNLAHIAEIDYIKTSTGVLGKADIPSVKVILSEIRSIQSLATTKEMGLKISGGLKTLADVMPYIVLAQEQNLMIDKTCFRIGTSTLLKELIKEGQI